MILLLDNFDSFTYNLVDYFNQINVDCKVIRNDIPLSEITKYTYKGIVLSPGPETPDKSGTLMQVLSYYHDKLPVLGICLGHQAIGQFFGGRVEKAEKPMHGKVCSIHCGDSILFKEVPGIIDVVRYNSLIVNDPSEALKVVAEAENGEIMALEHSHLPVHGVQFHPEAALTAYGLQILKNWAVYHKIAG